MDNVNSKKNLAGVIGYFESPEALMDATQKARNLGFSNIDTFTPYPIHGMDHAQGLSRSPLPFVTFAAGITGCSVAFILEYWTSAVSWPLNVGGKPFNSWPAFVPIMFELTVLFAGLSTVAGMFILNGLPNLTKKAFDPGLTRDRFALLIEALPEKVAKKSGAKPFEESEATQVLKSLGAHDIRSVFNEGWFS